MEVGLGLKAGPVEVEVGSIGTDLHVGQVTPVTTAVFDRRDKEQAQEH